MYYGYDMMSPHTVPQPSPQLSELTPRQYIGMTLHCDAHTNLIEGLFIDGSEIMPRCESDGQNSIVRHNIKNSDIRCLSHRQHHKTGLESF